MGHILNNNPPVRRNCLSWMMVSVLCCFSLSSCKKINEINLDPDITELRNGLQVSATVGYCASLARTLFTGESLPANVVFQSENNDGHRASGFMLVTINEKYPIPFNHNTGELWIGCLWDPEDYTGIISAVFTDISILKEEYELVGIYTIPVMEADNGDVMTVFAEQDIIVGEGSDTLIKISMTDPQFSEELARLERVPEEDAFAAVRQNAWIVTADQVKTPTTVYDDRFTIYGGGQIVEARGATGGILYHALIGTVFSPVTCSLNPIDGVGFIQNLKAGTELDLGHIMLNFHEPCNGKAFAEMAYGKYWSSFHRYVNLNL
jgi:hypothetical protein